MRKEEGAANSEGSVTEGGRRREQRTVSFEDIVKEKKKKI